jgi:hypothetical protein
MGSSMAEIIPDSRVPWIERIPTEETTRSNEWTTSGNRIKPEGSAMIKKNCDYRQDWSGYKV